MNSDSAVIIPDGDAPYSLADDTLYTPLAQEGSIAWYLCRRIFSGENFVLATAVSDRHALQATQLLKNEFALRDSLEESWALRPVTHTQYQGCYALIYPPFVFTSLESQPFGSALSMTAFLQLAIALCEPLGAMHQQGIVHGDIKPGHFLLNENGYWQLSGFGLAFNRPAEATHQFSGVGGTPVYMSPEHTSRIAHPLSSQSDLYSFGVVLYERLTGKLPFAPANGSEAEWTHQHIAAEPSPLHQFRPDIPPVLCELILRLLEKKPANRYQTVAGLLADLKRCLANLRDDNVLPPFLLGMQDSMVASNVGVFLQHPQATDLLALFGQVQSTNASRLVVIQGEPGSGKSSLIASFTQQLNQKNALIAQSRADQHSSVIPYGVITAAFRSLILPILGLPASDIERWKGRLVRLLGDFTGLAVYLLPELGPLLNTRAAEPADAVTESNRERFNHMVCSLLEAFAVPGAPVVMIIDDIHWADLASIQLLKTLLKYSADLPLLVVIGQRDLDSLPCPLAGEELLALQQPIGSCERIIPAPLSVKEVTHWLTTLHQAKTPASAQLAHIIHQKTGGNPLFAQSFFRQAANEGLIFYSRQSSRWYFDASSLQARQYTDNVASLVLEQLALMPATTQHLLARLACIGASGNLSLTAKLLEMDADELQRLLHPAMTAQLLHQQGEEYQFTHARVHEAAFALLSDPEQQQMHEQIARFLAVCARLTANTQILFRAVHHISLSVAVLRESSQWEELLGLSLMAAQRAKATGDYISALRFLKTAHALNGKQQQEHDFFISKEEAQCEFLQGNLTRAQALCHKLMGSSGPLADKTVIACLLAEIHMRKSEHQLALETALAWLTVFNIHISRNPTKAECDEARVRLKASVGKNAYVRFRPLPKLQDPSLLAVMELLASASFFAAFNHPRLHFMLICKMLHITMDHGITGASTLALSWYGVMCGDLYHEYSRGLASGLFALELVNRNDLKSYKAKTMLPLGQLSVWTMPLSYAIKCTKNTFNEALASGDRTIASLAIRHQAMNYLARGDHLDVVLTVLERGLAFVRKSAFADVESALLMQRYYVNRLRVSAEGRFTGADLFPDNLLRLEVVPTIANTLVLRFWWWLYQGMAHFMAGEYHCARDCLAQAAPLSENIPGHIHLMDFHLYSALALTIPLQPQDYTSDIQQALTRHYDRIALWAVENKGTFADKEALLRAERLRLEGQVVEAMECYESAITLSLQGEFHPVNAIANELTARYVQSCGLKTAGDAYIKKAMLAWRRWGAFARLRQLEQTYPQLVESESASQFHTIPFARNEAVHDLQSVLTAVRALTEEINLDRLIQILMTMLLERAGAQRCLLIRIRDGNKPEIEARAKTTSESYRVKIVNDTPLATDLPLSVLMAVIRTGQEIRTGQPDVYSPFSQDPYLVASGAAVMCVPMFKQARMVGVLYLENRLMPDVFSSEHSRIIRILAAQAAVSIETARLYAELLEENIQRRRIEKELRASQTSLMLGEKISHTGSWRWDVTQDLILMSDECPRILGLPHEQKTISMVAFLQMVHRDDVNRIQQLVDDSVDRGVAMRSEFRLLRPNGECRYLSGMGEPVEQGTGNSEYFGIITDITDYRQAEDAARVAQADLARVSRANTVGQLTASIAHEINQPLMSIVANAGASLRWLNRESPGLEHARQSLKEIVTEGQRAGDIIRGLQALTRNQNSYYNAEDLHQIAEHIMSLSRSELERHRVTVVMALKARASTILCDTVQIQQVLLNLVINAIDAMSSNDERQRVIRITSSNPDEGYVRLEVADTGTGLDLDVMKRIFDSFYTTKNHGMGMGLTISKGIIVSHRGTLQVANRDPYGCVFWFDLPLEAAEHG